ncbi:hypothetical protein LXA43DRAFT_990370, partial [Ganoderma leucocontextum]
MPASPKPLRTYAGSILRPTLLILTGFPLLAPLAPLGLPCLRPTLQPVPVPTVRNSWYNGTLATRRSLSGIFPAGTQRSTFSLEHRSFSILLQLICRRGFESLWSACLPDGFSVHAYGAHSSRSTHNFAHGKFGGARWLLASWRP